MQKNELAERLNIEIMREIKSTLNLEDIEKIIRVIHVCLDRIVNVQDDLTKLWNTYDNLVTQLENIKAIPDEYSE